MGIEKKIDETKSSPIEKDSYLEIDYFNESNIMGEVVDLQFSPNQLNEYQNNFYN